MPRIADLKIWVRITAAIWVVLAIIWAGAIVWTTQVNRDTAIRQAQDFSHSIHEMTMAGLTGMMITGTVGQREVFLDQIKQLSIIKDLHVARSPAVVEAFGADTKSSRQLDAVEQQVMSSGQRLVRTESGDGGTYLRVVTPTRAAKNYLGKDCLMCHQVPEGTVLGVVSMKVSLDTVEAEVAAFRLKISAAAAGVSLLLLVVIWFLTRHFVTAPLEQLTHGLRDIARGEGDLTRRLPVRGNDEIGQASAIFNEMMENFARLVRQVGDSARQVSTQAHELSTAAGRVTDGSRRQGEQAAQRTIEGARVATGEVATGGAGIGHEQRVADEHRLLVTLGEQVTDASGGVARGVHDRDAQAADRDRLAIGKEMVELAAVGGEARSGVEKPAEYALHDSHLPADRCPAAELFLEVGGCREVIGVDVRLENPLDAGTGLGDAADQPVSIVGADSSRLRVVIEHAVDDDAARSVSIEDEVAVAARRRIKESFNVHRDIP